MSSLLSDWNSSNASSMTVSNLCFSTLQSNVRIWTLLVLCFRRFNEFLVRIKMINKVAAASNLKAAGLHFNKKSSKAVIYKTADSAKADFITSAKKYIEHLLGAVLKQTGLSSDIVKGLAALDPYNMLKRPTEVALRHFGILYSTFQLRFWVTGPNEASCRDEHLALLDYLRTKHEHICYLFKLCSLCLTSVSPQYPAVVMGKIDTQGLQSLVADVVLPCQSYLPEVPDSFALCCTDANLDKFSLLSASLGQSGLSSDYDPWAYVDNFGCSSTHKSLMSSHRSVLSGVEVSAKGIAAADVPSVRDSSAVRLPSDTKRRRMERSQ